MLYKHETIETVPLFPKWVRSDFISLRVSGQLLSTKCSFYIRDCVVIRALLLQYMEPFRKCFDCGCKSDDQTAEIFQLSSQSGTVFLLCIIFDFIHNVMASLLVLHKRFLVFL
jgi:hypothetical protein